MKTGIKRLMIVSAIFFALLLAIPAWSHHAAEGIVTDEIWQMVDDLLVEEESPHLDMDQDDMGRASLVTSVVVDTDDVDYFVSAILEGLDGISRGTSAVRIEIDPIDDDMTEIRIYEPIGSGRSQIIPEMD